MSKIGRKPIDITGLKVGVESGAVKLKAGTSAGEFVLPVSLKAHIEGNNLFLEPAINLDTVGHAGKREIKRTWGLCRALLNNKVQGLRKPFEAEIQINGLGFKAIPSGDRLSFSLGYSHKIDFAIPKGVSIEVDKSGQKLKIKSQDKWLMGKVCGDIKELRPIEPYKGTGIQLAGEQILRKEGKTKGA
jgi:large subunit ribosomal protein L6